MSMISFEEAGFSYDGTTSVFRNLNLQIERGQFVCIIGSNGSGKSTLAKHINALLNPDEGRVYVDGMDTNDPQNTYHIRSQVGLVFQNPDDQLIASLAENDVAFGAENIGLEEDKLRPAVEKALVAVGLRGFEKREVDTMSGGQKQRLAIAGVLAMNPAVLVFDEASAMLDPKGRYDLLQTICDMHKRGMTIVMITHFMEEAAMAERIVVLDRGTVRMDGTPHEILTRADDLAACHLAVPFATRLSLTLRSRGVDIPTCITTEELKEELCTLHLNR